MEIRRGNASKAYQNVLKQKDIITDLLATTIKNNNLNEIKSVEIISSHFIDTTLVHKV